MTFPKLECHHALRKSPAVKGGQGRTPQDIESDATFLVVAVLAAAIVLGVALVLAGGAS